MADTAGGSDRSSAALSTLTRSGCFTSAVLVFFFIVVVVVVVVVIVSGGGVIVSGGGVIVSGGGVGVATRHASTRFAVRVPCFFFFG